MSKEKPKKRLVHKHHYVGTMLEKGGLYSFALGFGGGGCLFLLISLLLLWMGAPPWKVNDPDDMDRISMFVWGGLFGVLCFASTWACVTLFKAARAMEHVAPITRHNAGLLPEVETLVRASDIPPSHQQTELLRATQHGTETPAEELLRAAANRQGD